jgi:tetratricopeptide (TPR) repeat protein
MSDQLSGPGIAPEPSAPGGDAFAVARTSRWRGPLLLALALVLDATVAHATTALPAAPVADPRDVVAYVGIPDQVQRRDGYLRFRLWNSELNFALPAVSQTMAIVAAVQAAAAADRSVSVRFEIDSGRFGEPDSIPIYLAQELTIDGSAIEIPDLPDGRADPAPTAQQLALLRGLALGWVADYNRALSALALVSQPTLQQLPPRQQLLLYRVRGRTLENRARDAQSWPSDLADRDMILALQDHLVWAERQPDDTDAWYAIARTLRDLGAYADGLRVHDYIRRRWPAEALWVAIRAGGIRREAGDPAGAVRLLDSLEAEIGPQPGMAFHFNRAYALLQLGRLAEAVADLNAGIGNQPDYPWAYVYRACARAGLGQLQPALADLGRGGLILAREPVNSRGERYNRARIESMRGELQAALARNPAAPVAGLCDHFWHDLAVPRQRAAGIPAVTIPVLPGATVAAQPVRVRRLWWVALLAALVAALGTFRVVRARRRAPPADA